jgi:hypothetical protein
VNTLGCPSHQRINDEHHPISTEASRIVQKLWSYCSELPYAPDSPHPPAFARPRLRRCTGTCTARSNR